MRVPAPRALVPAFMFRRCAIGPPTSVASENAVVERTQDAKAGALTASTMDSSTGNCSGTQPAMTATAATFSTVTR